METFIVLLILGLSSWLFYRVFLQEISPKRHLRLKVQYRRVFTFWTLGAMTSFLFWVIQTLPEDHSFFFRLGAYLALCSILISAVTLIFIAQLLVYVYLFFNNMNVGVPRLIVNIFTLVFGTCVFGWLSSEIFGLALMPLVAPQHRPARWARNRPTGPRKSGPAYAKSLRRPRLTRPRPGSRPPRRSWNGSGSRSEGALGLGQNAPLRACGFRQHPPGHLSSPGPD